MWVMERRFKDCGGERELLLKVDDCVRDALMHVIKFPGYINDCNQMQSNVPRAYEGLIDKKRSKAAHMECRAYFASYSVFSLLINYMISLLKPYDEVPIKLPSLHNLLLHCEEECGYLDLIQEYLETLGDEWFDEDYHRENFLEEILEVLEACIEMLFALSGVLPASDRDFNFDLSFFLHELREVCKVEDNAVRSAKLPDVMNRFSKIRRVVGKKINELQEFERRLVEENCSAIQYEATFREPDYLKRLKKVSESAEKLGDKLLERVDDFRPKNISKDTRYSNIENILKIWYVMPPSVPRFIELCRYLEQAAVLAARDPYDYGFSSRPFIFVAIMQLDDHPKQGATTISDLAFTDDERDHISVAVKGMAKALLRLRSKLRSDVGFGSMDIDSCDDFFAFLPRALGPDSRDYKALVFEEGVASMNDGFNAKPFTMLGYAAHKRHIDEEFITPELMKDRDVVARLLKKAFANGSRTLIEETYEQIIKKYFKKASAGKSCLLKRAEKDEQMVVAESSESDIVLPEPEPGYKETFRYSYAPKFARIIDMDNRGAPYFIEPYENITNPKAVDVIKTLLKASEKNDSKDGWVKCDKNWRYIFKDHEYKRFKLDQIQIGSRGNQHLGEWRLIPRGLFRELTKAVKKQ